MPGAGSRHCEPSRVRNGGSSRIYAFLFSRAAGPYDLTAELPVKTNPASVDQVQIGLNLDD